MNNPCGMRLEGQKNRKRVAFIGTLGTSSNVCWKNKSSNKSCHGLDPPLKPLPIHSTRKSKALLEEELSQCVPGTNIPELAALKWAASALM